MKSAEQFLQKLGELEAPQHENGLGASLEKGEEEADVAAVAELRRAMEGKAVALLAMREHGALELKQKLQSKFPETEDLLAETGESPGLVKRLADEVVAYCAAQNWQSDARYVEQAVRNYMDKGHGPLKIRQTLQRACDASASIDAHLDLEVADWLAIMQAVLIKKYGEASKPASRNEQARRMRFLQSRGFPGEWIWKLYR